MHNCPAYQCKGILEKNGEDFTCPICNRTYGKIAELKDYEDYENLFKDDLVACVRKLLEKIANEGDDQLEDSDEHNDLIEYFNRFCLHRKVNKEKFEISQFRGVN